MGKWLGKTINPLGTYRGIYFNKSFDIGEVFKLLKQLPYKEIHGAPAYTIFNGKDSNENYVLVLAIYEPQSKWYEIHITKEYNGGTKMYTISPSSLENEYFDFGFEATGTLDSENYNNGEEKYNDLIKTYVSSAPIRYDNSFSIQMHPINEDGSLDKTINLFPKTRMSAIEDSEGNPVVETELELSDSEPSANAKELKKVLMNGTEWKVTGSGGGEEVLVLNVTSVEDPVYVDDATHQKIIDKKVPRIRLVMPQTQEIDISIDCQLNTALSQGGLENYVYTGWFQFMSLVLVVVYYDSSRKAFVYQSNIEYAKGGNIRDMQGSGNSLGTSTIVDGELTFRIYTDNETLENDTYLCKTKAVKAYVDNAIGTAVSTILEGES